MPVSAPLIGRLLVTLTSRHLRIHIVASVFKAAAEKELMRTSERHMLLT
jgi:hypothetical protein